MDIEVGQTITCHGLNLTIGELIGHGKSGYSYLASDGNGRRYVYKKIHHEPCDYYSFGNKMEAELSAYDRLRRIGIPVPELLDHDLQEEWLLKEYAEGDTAFSLVKSGKLTIGVLNEAKRISALAKDNGINIDYFPTNFVYDGSRLFYVD